MLAESTSSICHYFRCKESGILRFNVYNGKSYLIAAICLLVKYHGEFGLQRKCSALRSVWLVSFCRQLAFFKHVLWYHLCVAFDEARLWLFGWFMLHTQFPCFVCVSTPDSGGYPALSRSSGTLGVLRLLLCSPSIFACTRTSHFCSCEWC